MRSLIVQVTRGYKHCGACHTTGDGKMCKDIKKSEMVTTVGKCL